MTEKMTGNGREMDDREFNQVTGGSNSTANLVKIYSGPGREYTVLRYVMKHSFTLTGETGKDSNWKKVSAPVEGWVYVHDLTHS